ncbi:aminotransferase class V-fold PLP-dependent enzyme [Nonomuraea sp. NPDC050328]|uniref:aminotransferase class V-fold PLP-dependent enzyme n=1 Tax=Nonomuraea sp. NPDC050328 TaxID=3364361 RepID=UPI0037B10FF0
MNALIDAKDLFEADPGFLNTASYGLPPRAASQALDTALAQWRRGSTDWSTWDAATDRARAGFARLLDTTPDHVTISSTGAQLVSSIATALPPGARVLVPDIEFTSNLFPWAQAATVETAPPERLADAIHPGLDAVAFSLVQSATGQVAALTDIITAARAHDLLVVTDASQAAGWLPFTTDGLDAVVCSAYKWLMAPRGAAFAYTSPRLRERMRPLAANWYGTPGHAGYYGLPMTLSPDAAAFDLSPAWFCYVGAAPALDLINELGVPAIHAHNLALANRFRAGLGQPPGDSAIVTTPGADAAKLQAAGVRAAVRAGNLRASFHLYNTTDDVDRALEALA